MARVKRGVTSKRKHKRLLKSTEGYRMTYNRLVKRAHEAALHAGQYAYAGHKLRKRDMRSLWITRISAIVRENGMKYSTFMDALKKKNISLNRKTLSQMAMEDKNAFTSLLKSLQ